MTDLEFTFSEYASLLETFEKRGYRWVGYEGPVPSRAVVHRHDVDYSPRKALRMARIEAERDATATYFVLVSSPFYNVLDADVGATIREIEALGHDVALHFDTGAYWDEEPTESELSARVAAERDVLETAVGSTVATVSFHNPPDWALRREFEGFVSAYEPRFFDAIAYVADANQRWREANPFESSLPEALQMVTHPVLWGDRPGDVVDRLEAERTHLCEKLGRKMDDQNRVWSNER